VKAASLAISDAAASDILEQADWYEAQSGRSLAERWEKAVTSAILNIVRSPNSGTPCSFKSPELRHVRRISIVGFPKHLIFYRFSEGEIFVLRVVHGARDLERLL
jgi:toxin ParE1/3/4